MFKKSIKILTFVIIIIALSGFTFAYAAANTVPTSKAGDGSGAVTGYTVTAVVYHLNATNPTLIDSVSFTLNAAANLVKIRLLSTGTTWYACTGTTAISCTTTGATVLLTDTLQVVAASN
jgi:hypothetical protein